jgi:tetratricopeptide (TPR) repeat protein
MYRAAFAAAGLPSDGDAAALAAAVRAERPRLREALTRALDGWLSGLEYPPDPDAARVRAAADLADPDPARKEVRATVAAGDGPALARLAGRLAATDLDPVTAVALGGALIQKGMAADAVRILRGVRDRHPSDPSVQCWLQWALRESSPGDPVVIEESVGCGHAEVAAHPERAAGHYHLGQAYDDGKHDLAAAEPHYLKALELNPRFTFAMINLGYIRKTKGDLAGAARWYRKAAETDPSFAMANLSLGQLLVQMGDLAGAEAEYRRGVELEPGSASARSRLAHVQRMAALLPRLDDMVAGRAEPADAAEALDFAELCHLPFRRQYAAAARLCDRAFVGDPKRVDDLGAAHRYNAATYAARAGCGQGTDAPADPAGRAALRGKALGWLRADLALRARQADSDKLADRHGADSSLLYWLDDPNLAGVRPGPGRIDLPADERAAWDTFWAEVRATRDRARKPVPAGSAALKPGTSTGG